MRCTSVVSLLVTVSALAGTGYSAKNAPKYLTDKTRQFAVDGDHLPEVDFSLGESYAGTLPITEQPGEERKYFFWFHPSQRPVKEKQIIIWLNGGPGCSSFIGAIKENGPLLWQDAISRPIPNRWSWNKLADVIYVDQPLGTGLSSLNGKKATIKNEDDLAKDFMGFWKNFVATFDLHGYEVYLTGESYAGMFLPYIGGNMLDAKDKENFNLAGMLIYDGVIGDYDVLTSVPTLPYIEKYQPILNLNESTMEQLRDAHHKCGYAEYMDKYLKFPPAGPQPTLNLSNACSQVYEYALQVLGEVNPCFDIYHIRAFCPLSNNGFGEPGMYPPGAAKPSGLYLDRDDVKKALHAPQIKYSICADHPVFAGQGDTSEPSIFHRLPQVIEATNKVIYSHADLDFRLLSDGALLSIQNMTWHGVLGLQKSPLVTPAYVPAHSPFGPDIKEGAGIDYSNGTLVERLQTVAGSGYYGTYGEERGLLTMIGGMAGHEVPAYQPALALRQIEYLLGRIKSVGEVSPFTIEGETNWPQPRAGESPLSWEEWARREAQRNASKPLRRGRGNGGE